jgi:hypothetical protein
MKLIPFFTFLFLLSQNAFASLSIAEFEEKSKSQSTDTYILGFASGLSTANSALVQNKTPPLFCLPPFLKLTVPDYKEIVALGIKDVPANRPNREAMDVNEILLKKLIQLYPCGYN